MRVLRKRVAAGAEFLDKKVRGWFKKIDFEKLDMYSNTRCILGQLAIQKGLKGAFALGSKLGLGGINAFFLYPAVDPYITYGFQAHFSKLQEKYWKQEVNKRLEAVKPKAKPKKAAPKKPTKPVARKKPTKKRVCCV